MKIGFFAYPFKELLSETIREAVEQINQSGHIYINTWESLSINGRVLIDQICKQIDDCDLFCADLTDLNPNVLFELGYAIGKRKKVWLVRDTSFHDYESNYKKLQILTTVGYLKYNNSKDISKNFLDISKPYNDTSHGIYQESIEPRLNPDTKETVLYLKSKYDDNPSIGVTRTLTSLISKHDINIIYDDPSESTSQPLTWYGSQISSACIVICHLLNVTKEGAKLHNARYSLVAGLAKGMGKPSLMLIEENAFSPADYRDILFVYKTATQAESYIQQNAKYHIDEAAERNEKYSWQIESKSGADKLCRLRVGQWVAENEESELVNNIYQGTRDYEDAKQGRKSIFIGRKGVGKSATFIKLAAELKTDRRNVIGLIRPWDYELQTIINTFQSYASKSIRSNALESLWKILIYTELLQNAFEEIDTRPSDPEGTDKRIYDYVIKHPWIQEDFSQRLTRSLSIIDSNKAGGEIRLSEFIHKTILPPLTDLVLAYMKSRNRAFILVDNLDKTWDKSGNVEFMSEFLLALINISPKIQNELNLAIQDAKLNIVIFLRADIFRDIIKYAPEPDKIDYARISWEDDISLMRLAEIRLQLSLGTDILPYKGNPWDDFFPKTINGVPVKKYIFNAINHRPRDLLFFLNETISRAVNLRRPKINEEDILHAEGIYSSFAYDSIGVELNYSFKEWETFMMELLGGSRIVYHQALEKIISNCTNNNPKQIIDLLIGCDFIRLKVGDNDFRMAKDDSDIKKLTKLAERYSRESNSDVCYQIHRAYWIYLELKNK